MATFFAMVEGDSGAGLAATGAAAAAAAAAAGAGAAAAAAVGAGAIADTAGAVERGLGFAALPEAAAAAAVVVAFAFTAAAAAGKMFLGAALPAPALTLAAAATTGVDVAAAGAGLLLAMDSGRDDVVDMADIGETMDVSDMAEPPPGDPKVGNVDEARGSSNNSFLAAPPPPPPPPATLPISGHGYSRDGLHWTFSRTEPYTGAVQRADGTVKNYATMERPKLLFADPNDPTRPTHLLNGASPVWDADGKNACGACETAACVKCKVSPGMDWTYTVVRPLSL